MSLWKLKKIWALVGTGNCVYFTGDWVIATVVTTLTQRSETCLVDNDPLNCALHESILVACREEGRRQEAAQCTPSSNVLRSMSCFLLNIACPVADVVVNFPALVQGKSSSFVRRFCIEAI